MLLWVNRGQKGHNALIKEASVLSFHAGLRTGSLESKVIVREHIQEKSEGLHSQNSSDPTHGLNEFGIRLFVVRHCRNVASHYHGLCQINM